MFSDNSKYNLCSMIIVNIIFVVGIEHNLMVAYTTHNN